MKILNRATLLGFFIVFLVTSCQRYQKQNAERTDLTQDSQNIVSTRGKANSQFFIFLRLKTPALLITSQQVNGVTVINDQQKKQIEQEQQELIDSLKAISSDVQVVYRYKLVMNGLAVVGPKEIQSKILSLPSVASYEEVGQFGREMTEESMGSFSLVSDYKKHNSSKFIGAEKLHQLGIKGQGIKVGVLDTGIDYTHSMLGGPGTVASFKSIDPSQSSSLFPNDKVVGGIDLVGSDYDASSLAFKYRIPRPDLNPLDEGSHGTHVAGTIAGHGDYINSYDGVAPEASLYAIKVFGKTGSTSDMVVIAGLEYAIDPNGDGDLSDQLDIVNLSLGSGYGNPKIMYAEALKNVVRAGTLAVVAAGNSGDKDYIVSAPGTATEALSVASSIDDTEHNWKSNASLIEFAGQKIYVEAVEATTTKKISEGSVAGELYYIGYADKDLSSEQAAQLNGKVALIDRGVVNFDDKIKRAAGAGAIGVVVVSGLGQSVISMGTIAQYDIPAIMINNEVGSKVKAALKTTTVNFYFKADKMIEKKENIDTISTFSSRGPRSMDGFLKPEITAPGQNIISAEAGKGNQTIQKSGTSMATPHMAGAAALLKQKLKSENKRLSALEMKNVLMGTTQILFSKSMMYSLARQGAGRVQIDKAIDSKVVANLPSFSFGEINLNQKTNLNQSLQVKNISDDDLDLSLQFTGSSAIEMKSIKNFRLSKDGQINLNINFVVNESLLDENYRHEVEGFVNIIDKSNNSIIYHVPLLIVLYKNSSIKVDKMNKANDNVTLSVSNNSNHSGDFHLFNLISLDGRKSETNKITDFMTTDCDLQSAGYRILSKKNADGEQKKVIQFAVKVYKQMTTWQSCDVSVLFYSDKKMLFDQELVATQLATVIPQGEKKMASLLIDAAEARSIRNMVEREIEVNENDPAALKDLKDKLDYSLAVSDYQDIQLYNSSTLIIMEADLDLINKDSNGNLSFQILTSHYDQSVVQFDNYLYKDKSNFITVPSDIKKQPFYNFSENERMNPSVQREINLKKGSGKGDMIGYFPMNAFSLLDTIDDQQSQIINGLK